MNVYLMNNMPLISIITVSYNAVATIEKTIFSVINQTYTNIEYVIIDGGSIDGTVDVIKKYSKKIQYWISESDNGIYDAMNKGIKIATGDFLLFLGADDVLNDRMVIQKVASYMDTASTIYYGNVRFKQSNKVYLGEFSKMKLALTNICHQAIFYPHCLFAKYRYELEYIIYADYVLNLKCWGDDSLEVKYMNEVVTVYNEMGKSSQLCDDKFRRDRFKLIWNNLGFCYAAYATLRLSIHSIIR